MKPDRMEVGTVYKSKSGRKVRCIVIVDDLAFCVSHYDYDTGVLVDTAYSWDVNTGKAVSLPDNGDYDIILNKTIQINVAEAGISVKFSITEDKEFVPDSLVVEELDSCLQ
jgi:hypothetical protein